MYSDRRLLQRLQRGPVSGGALAAELGISRAAVWKRIEVLRAMGLQIKARAGHGYRLESPPEWLNAEAITAVLPAALHAELAQLEIAWSIPSTNTALLTAPLPDVGCRVLLAEHQSGGRGRHGRVWQSPLGGQLAMSVLRGFDGGLARLGGLSLVAGVAVAEALYGAGFREVRLKWPNDVVVPGPDGLRKLAGILVEGGGEQGGRARGVIGIGLNLRLPAGAVQIDQPWIDLFQLGKQTPSRNALAGLLLAYLLPALQEFDRDGLMPFVGRYAGLDALYGQPVEVRMGRTVQRGVAAGIAADGALRVCLGEGERQFHAGEVSLRLSPSPVNERGTTMESGFDDHLVI